jgi:hypothetical protein
MRLIILKRKELTGRRRKTRENGGIEDSVSGSAYGGSNPPGAAILIKQHLTVRCTRTTFHEADWVSAAKPRLINNINIS